MNKLVFGRINYIILLAGIGILILGFLIMTMDKQDYGFGFLGLTLGPIVVIMGFITQFFAILYKGKEESAK